MILCFFFFSSRRRHTRCSRDWSSDVCSSDLWIQHLGCHPLPESASPRKSTLWEEFFVTQRRLPLLRVENHANSQVAQIGCSRTLHGGKGASGFRQDHGNSGGSGKNMDHPAEKCT